MNEVGLRRSRRYGTAIVVTLAGLTAGAAVILWSWNTFAVELFAGPVIRFRHAVALEFGFLVVASAIALLARALHGGRYRWTSP